MWLVWLLTGGGTYYWTLQLIAASVLGLATGLARAALPALPLASAGVLIVAYLAGMLAMGLWAAQCWECAPGYQDWPRKTMYGVSAFWAGLVLALTIVGIDLGVLVTRYLQAAPETSRR
jgi:hypothetical protein